MTEDERTTVQGIRTRTAAATAGPWLIELWKPTLRSRLRTLVGPSDPAIKPPLLGEFVGFSIADQLTMCHATHDLTFLLAVIDAQEEEIVRLRKLAGETPAQAEGSDHA